MSNKIEDLLELMKRLRDPREGCPWDLEQTCRTIAPHTIEEAYEVVEAIEADDPGALRDELGDLLFQVVFYAQITAEDGAFGFDDVVEAIIEKMIRRHPHVFGDATVATAEDQTRAWEAHKEAEWRAKSGSSAPESALSGVTSALPAATRAVKLQKRAARVGFDWPDWRPVFAKIDEEIEELRAEVEGGVAVERIAEEIGDVLFALTNLARHLKVDPETALRGTNRRFERRFRRVEALLAEAGTTTEQAGIEEMEKCWQIAKAEESPNKSTQPIEF
jgi:ATP diphosphatase